MFVFVARFVYVRLRFFVNELSKLPRFIKMSASEEPNLDERSKTEDVPDVEMLDSEVPDVEMPDSEVPDSEMADSEEPDDSETFDEFLLLSPPILQGLKDAKFRKPLPLQLRGIPLGKCGLDLITYGRSGAGKTVMFGILALEIVDTTNDSLQVLAFAPTKEIAMHIEDVIKTIGKHIIPKLQIGSFFLGMSIRDSTKRIKKCHIAVGPPGYLKQVLGKGCSKDIRLVILDQADKLMETKFQNYIHYIYERLPVAKQVITASETYTKEFRKFQRYSMHLPTVVTPDVDIPSFLGLKQFVTVVKEHGSINQQQHIKTSALKHLLSNSYYSQCLVFCNTQTRAQHISNSLKKEGWLADYISKADTKSKRFSSFTSLNIIELKKFKSKILLTTDPTARNIKTGGVNIIINYDIPCDATTYLHRMARRGNGRLYGLAITIAGDNKELKKLQMILGDIGGMGLSIAKIPTDQTVRGMWTSDYESYRKLDSIWNKDDANYSTSKNLLKAGFYIKATRRDCTDEVSVTKALASLTTNENYNPRNTVEENTTSMNTCEEDVDSEVVLKGMTDTVKMLQSLGIDEEIEDDEDENQESSGSSKTGSTKTDKNKDQGRERFVFGTSKIRNKRLEDFIKQTKSKGKYVNKSQCKLHTMLVCEDDVTDDEQDEVNLLIKSLIGVKKRRDRENRALSKVFKTLNTDYLFKNVQRNTQQWKHVNENKSQMQSQNSSAA